MLTKDNFKKIFPDLKNIDEWWEAMSVLNEHDINTDVRIAMFLSQCAHESNNFTQLIENLNYGSKGLMATWPKRFQTIDIAEEYARKPEKIANKVYADRLGNGSEESGDGWKYRGRGIIQITGKDNYTRCSKVLFGDDTLLVEPDLLTTPLTATLSACWFWEINRLNSMADKMDVIGATKIINGGSHGIENRENNFKRIMKILCQPH